MQAELEVALPVAAPPERLFAVLADWTRQGEWMPATAVRVVDGEPLAVGTQVSARTGLGPLGFTDTMTVTGVARGPDGSGLFEVLHTGRVVRGVGTFAAEPDAAGSRFVWWERVEVPGGPVAPLLWLVGGPVTRLLFGWAARRLRRIVEAEAEAVSVVGTR